MICGHRKSSFVNPDQTKPGDSLYVVKKCSSSKIHLHKFLNNYFKMNDIVNECLLNGDKFMPELH